MTAPLLACCLLLAAPSAQTTVTPTTPQTVPEATGHQRTSTAAEVAAFVQACRALPHGDRLATTTIGSSHEGRELVMVRAALPDCDERQALRALVIGNIHAGEVEGKEALQQIVREIALGGHDGILRHCVLHLLPIYNVDGNERIDARNRPEQNGPDAVGQRANAQGLDLNRDFVKAEAPETRALLAQFEALDPHLFVDLHTTNGSFHGYHLTYAPSLSPNVDPGIAALTRDLLDDARAALGRHQPPFHGFDYGNFETRDWDGGGAPESERGRRGWWSYDHRPRYGVNYFGLRNRIAVLSEAYSYCDFPTRIAVTRAFVLGLLAALVQRRAAVLERCAAADRRLTAPEAPVWFGYDTGFGDPEWLPVLVGECERIPLGDGRRFRHARKDVATPETMAVFRRFRSRQQLALPLGWALPAPPDGFAALLQRHGIRCETWTAPRTATVERFTVSQQRKPKRPFQGHQELLLVGAYGRAASEELPAGTLWIDARQPLGRLGAQLLEPISEDSLSTWNFLEASTGDTYPVLRVVR